MPSGFLVRISYFMYLMYVDESGDPGMKGSPTKYFVLSGIVLHELRWSTYLDQILDFRRRMRDQHGLKLREEFHAYEMISKPGSLKRIRKHDRLTIVRNYTDEIASISDLNIINIVIDKTNKADDFDVFDLAWRALIQRFENTIVYGNFPGPMNPSDTGIVIPDMTSVVKLTKLLRKMRAYNPVPNRDKASPGYTDRIISNVIEDPIFRDSKDSYFVQSADLAAYLLYQKLNPCSYMRKNGGHKYFDRLDSVLCKKATYQNEQGIVFL
jgi:hypothetical protein